MDANLVANALRAQLHDRPYWTTAALFGVGWMIGRALPLSAVLAVAGLGTRLATATAVEHALAECLRPRAAREQEEA